MQIKFTQGLAGLDFVYAKGQVIDLPASEAKSFIEAGVAIPAQETAVLPKKETANLKTKKK
jgi:hypothetical protein